MHNLPRTNNKKPTQLEIIVILLLMKFVPNILFWHSKDKQNKTMRKNMHFTCLVFHHVPGLTKPKLIPHRHFVTAHAWRFFLNLASKKSSILKLIDYKIVNLVKIQKEVSLAKAIQFVRTFGALNNVVWRIFVVLFSFLS